jgi:ligand-binding SRPBCC domain-containing protein
MKTFHFKTQQDLPITVTQAWDFFSSPKNLARITPAFLDFNIVPPFEDKEIFAGMHIHYTVKPLFNIPLKWTTEITKAEKPFLFVDKQIRGPYAFWEHTHHFSEIENGVLAEDHVRYSLPLGAIGAITLQWFVKKKIEQIFAFRRKMLNEIFQGGMMRTV